MMIIVAVTLSRTPQSMRISTSQLISIVIPLLHNQQAAAHMYAHDHRPEYE